MKEVMGLNNDEKEKVFNSFFQGENPKNQQNGVGLGLSICKEIIAQ